MTTAPIPRPHHPVDARRKQIFIDALKKTGSLKAAATLATAHPTGKNGGLKSFLDAARADPDFAAQIQAARDEALGVAEKTLFDLATGLLAKPVYRNSGLVGSEPIYDVQALLRILERHDTAWRPSKHIDATVKTTSINLDLTLTISPEDIALLPKGKREVFTTLLIELEEAKANATKHQPEGVIVSASGEGERS